jgi:hypothetical protein
MTRSPNPADQQAFIRRLVTVLEGMNVQYAIGGSIAAMEYSESRLTLDVDIMVLAEANQIEQLVDEITAWQIYIDPLEAVLEDIVPHDVPINVYDGTAGAKADLFVVKAAGLPGLAMSRRRYT